MIRRLAYISVHTSPLEQPGFGDAGGMNVYVDELARTMAERGIAVDVFTRRTDPEQPDSVEVAPGYTVVHVDAGPPWHVPKSHLPEYVAEFAEEIVKRSYTAEARYDIVHSHYWLSGWAGVLVKEALGIPLANSFHTLGRVKDLTRRADDPPAPLLRIAAEADVIRLSDCVIASTPAEAQDLIEHYDASPERLCVSPPGIDHEVFSPGPQLPARQSLGLGLGPLALFVGRIQPLKGLDIAVRALGMLSRHVAGVRLAVVGGPSGPDGAEEVERVKAIAVEAGVADRITWFPAQAHGRLARFYRAADVLLVPSRSESFGLVAAEAQACGLPVVASRVGGLAYLVEHGESGFLVDRFEPAEFSAAAGRVLTDPELASRLAAGAVANAGSLSWDATADRFLELYEGILGDHHP